MASPLETTLLLSDQQCSVLHTVNAQAHKPMAYTAYGHRPAESGITCLLGFNGEPPDPLTGHYLLGNGYRAFNPALMRFNSPDSLSPFGEGGLNGYAYCLGDPVNRVDPTGHAPLLHSIRKLLSNLFRSSRHTKSGIGRSITKNKKTASLANTIGENDVALGYHGSPNPKKLNKHGYFNKGEVYVTSHFENAQKYAGKKGTVFAVHVEKSQLDMLSARNIPKTNSASYVSEMPINVHEARLIKATAVSSSSTPVDLLDVFAEFGRTNAEYHQDILKKMSSKHIKIRTGSD